MSGISMIQYFTTKIRLAKEAGFDNVYQQLLAVWNGLDIDIREHILEPDEDTTIERFRKSLEERERLWKEKLLRNRYRPQRPGQRYGVAGANSFGNDTAARSNERPWMAPAQNPSAPRYSGWRNNNAPGRINQPAPRLQIAAAPHPAPTPNKAPPFERKPTANWTPGRRPCAKCGGQHMDYEHEYYQNSANANRRPTKAFYLDVLQHGMENYSRDEVAECISAYHAAEDDQPAAVGPGSDEVHDLQNVGGSNWFVSDASRSYTDFDSEIDYIAQYPVAKTNPTNSDHSNGGRPANEPSVPRIDHSRTRLGVTSARLGSFSEIKSILGLGSSRPRIKTACSDSSRPSQAENGVFSVSACFSRTSVPGAF